MPVLSDNPFSTKNVRPGELRYRFEDGNLESIAQQLIDHQMTGQIVGPHGSGKSTLVHDLIQCLSPSLQQVKRVVIREDHSLSTTINTYNETGANLLVVDGLERLPWLHRFLLVQSCKKQNSGLLITSHQTLNDLPVIFQTGTSFKTFCQIVDQLAPNEFQESELKAVFDQHTPNAREALMTLYDRAN